MSLLLQPRVMLIPGCIFCSTWEKGIYVMSEQRRSRSVCAFGQSGMSILCFITKTSLFKYTENFTTKKWKFSDKISDIFSYFFSKHCEYSLEPPRWGGSNEYPQYMFLSRNKKNNVYPCKPQFYYIKVGFKRHVFVMVDIYYSVSGERKPWSDCANAD